jgi:hypothetical protein
MAFREKIAWAAFVTTVLIWGGYFAVVATRAHAHDLVLLWLFIAATIAQAVLMAAVTAIWAIRSPGEAHAPADERDRAIGRSATGIAYIVVLLGIVAIIVWLHLGLRGMQTVFALAAVFILGEAVRFGAQAIGYRQGA